MLAKHTAETLLEVLMFALARQMVVVHETMVDTLIGIVALGAIFAIRKYLLLKTPDKQKIYDKLLKESRLRDSPPVADRFCDRFPHRRSALPAEFFYFIGCNFL